MNKYWIHEPTGKKAMVVKEESYFVWLLWKDEKFDWRLYKRILKEFYIPITKAEYDSGLTLNEIKRNRKGDKLEESLNKVPYLVEQYDAAKTALEQSMKNIIGKKVKCIAPLDGCQDIFSGDVFIVKGCSEDTISMINAIGSPNDIYCIALKDFHNHFKVIDEPSNKETKDDKVNHPSHYTWLKNLCGIEVIDITRHLDFDCGNAVKYLLRAGHKEEKGYTNKDKTIEDLKKAIFYINDKIKMLQDDKKN